jgi:hypothetical protein
MVALAAGRRKSGAFRAEGAALRCIARQGMVRRIEMCAICGRAFV